MGIEPITDNAPLTDPIATYEGFLQVQAANKVDIRTGFKGSISNVYDTFMEAADYIDRMVASQCNGTDSLKSNVQIQTEQGSVHSFQFNANVRDYNEKMLELAEKLKFVANIDKNILETYLAEDDDPSVESID